jgi:hypothetical protein
LSDFLLFNDIRASSTDFELSSHEYTSSGMDKSFEYDAFQSAVKLDYFLEVLLMTGWRTDSTEDRFQMIGLSD